MSGEENETTLRFALITEAALEQLRPRANAVQGDGLGQGKSAATTPQGVGLDDIYTLVHKTVHTAVEQKLLELNLDKIIEQMVHKVLQRELNMLLGQTQSKSTTVASRESSLGLDAYSKLPKRRMRKTKETNNTTLQKKVKLNKVTQHLDFDNKRKQELLNTWIP